MKIVLIRHFQTLGNQAGRYIGITDEDLLEIKEPVDSEQYPEVDRIYVSPLKRCIQTAEHIYPGHEFEIVEQLKECDFGSFENKNYQELSENPDYQEWINHGGHMRFPMGEDPDEFLHRCREAFLACIEKCLQENVESVAFVVHGGTIMSIMSAYDIEARTFYDYQVGNGKGYVLTLREDEWKQGLHVLECLEKIK